VKLCHINSSGPVFLRHTVCDHMVISFESIPVCDGQTDRHTVYTYVAL